MPVPMGQSGPTPPNREPKVSVYGIPQSQFSQSQLPGAQPQGGGIEGHFRQHWAIWLVGIGLATLALLWWINHNNSSSLANAAQDSQYGYGTGNSSPDQLWGSQLDADYQQMMSNQNNEIGLLQQLVNKSASPSTSPPPAPTPTPPGGCPQEVMCQAGMVRQGCGCVPGGVHFPPQQHNGLLNFDPETSLAWGQKLNIAGVTYLTGWGGNGTRLWGVPYHPGMTLQQWNKTPVGSAKGDKVLIYSK